MSTTTSDLPGASSPPQRNLTPADKAYLFTILSVLSILSLILVVSVAIALQPFLLRWYHTGSREQFDDIFHRHRDPPRASRRKNFETEPKLWDAWIRVDDQGKDSANELANIKPLALMYVPQKTTEPKNKASTSSVPQLEQELQHERPSAFLTGPFVHPLPLPRHPYENDRPGSSSAHSSAGISRTVQVSVVISMPTPNHRKLLVSANKEKGFPNVAIGFTRLPFVDE
ncbi:hypothetical protein BDM02DRAFT_3122691 [Thelephora ganbajun]|uniref:Uncharacterized protein n=1 Tax=Thelephora ganbajun TaxID=370292 RepID=A0ACB6Z2L7_THEGA|nr:hypothetical protein BDM02DRAFT_3122691 [Thelephora ganbajun]